MLLVILARFLSEDIFLVQVSCLLSLKSNFIKRLEDSIPLDKKAILNSLRFVNVVDFQFWSLFGQFGRLSSMVNFRRFFGPFVDFQVWLF